MSEAPVLRVASTIKMFSGHDIEKCEKINITVDVRIAPVAAVRKKGTKR